MRAIQMVAPGETNVLLAADIPRPDLINASDVLVRVHAAGVNPIDAKIRKLNMYYPGRFADDSRMRWCGNGGGGGPLSNALSYW